MDRTLFWIIAAALMVGAWIAVIIYIVEKIVGD